VALALALAAVSSLAAVDLVAAGPPASATSAQEMSESAAVADVLGVEAADGASVLEDSGYLEELTASRAQRNAEQAAAAVSQQQAEEAARAEAERLAAEAAAAAEAERQAAEAAEAAAAGAGAPAPAGTAATAIAQISNSAGAVRPQAQAAADAVVSNVPGAAGITIGGTRASAADPGGHPSGLALDYMVLSDAALGDAIAAYHIAHWDELGVEYIIWQQRILQSPGGSWSTMSNRGSATANHMDHVHVNYR
jgi:hypothetical protein